MANTSQESSWIPNKYSDVDSETMNILSIFIEEVPNLPVHVHKLLKIISDINSNASEIAKIASSDPAMVSKILKIVNSSYFGLSKKTDNLHFAIVLLGYNEVRKIELQTSFSKMFGDSWEYKGYSTKGLWEHCYLVSVCAEAMWKVKDPQHIGELMTLGLLHDIGKYALFKLGVILKKKGKTPLRSGHFPSQAYLMEKEEILFNVNHAIMGSLLAKKWGLSERICNVLEYHHYPCFWSIDSISTKYLRDVAIICISDLIVNYIIDKEKLLPEPAPEYFELIDLTPPLENVVSDELKQKIKKAQSFITYIK